MEEKKNIFKKMSEWFKGHLAATVVIVGVFILVVASVVIIAKKNSEKDRPVIVGNGETSFEDALDNESKDVEDATTVEKSDEPITEITSDGHVIVVTTEISDDGSVTTKKETMTDTSGEAVTVIQETTKHTEEETTKKKEEQTQTPTQPQTQAPTQPQTQAPTQPQTQAPTEPQTQAPTKPAADKEETDFKDGGGEYVVSGSNVIITDGGNASGSITIPDTIDGKKVTEIKSDAFMDSDITSLTITGNIKIGTNSFIDCKSLKSVVFGEGVTEIPYGVFSGCTALTSVTLPSTIRKVDVTAFGGFSDFGLMGFSEAELATMPLITFTVKASKNNVTAVCAFDSSVNSHELEKELNDAGMWGRGRCKVIYK